MASSDVLTEGFLAKEAHFTERSIVLWANLSSSKGFEILIRYSLHYLLRIERRTIKRPWLS